MSKCKKKCNKRILSFIPIIILVMCMIILCNVSMSAKRGTPPSIFGYSISYVPTNSMEPKIKQKSYVFFKKIKYDDVKQNDIVVYKSKTGDMAGKYIIHRVKEITDNGFIMKGDNNVLDDTELVTPDMVYGKYVKTAEFFTLFSLRINRNVVFFLLIISFACVLFVQIFSVILTVSKEAKKDLDIEKQKKKLLDEMRTEIYKEELEKLKKEKNNLQ